MIRLIIDTDVALGVQHEGRPRDIDDGFAIVEAINSPEIELALVTTVFGNAPHAEVSRVAEEIVGLKGGTVPVAHGAAAPLQKQGPLPPPNDAVRQMAAELERAPCHIAAIGPLTNMGLLAHHFPDALARAQSVIIVAGRSAGRDFYLGDAGPVRDFNFENDVRATQLLLESGAPMVLAGFELTSQVTITETDLAEIARSDSGTAAYFHRNSIAWCRYWTDQFPVDDGFHPWDSAAVSWLKHPEYFAADERGWRIDDGGKTARLECDAGFPGHRVRYLHGFSEGGAAAFVRDVIDNVW